MMYRIRFVEKVHEDGIQSVEVVVNAEDQFGAVARATLILKNKGIEITWVEEVSEVIDPMST